MIENGAGACSYKDYVIKSSTFYIGSPKSLTTRTKAETTAIACYRLAATKNAVQSKPETIYVVLGVFDICT